MYAYPTTCLFVLPTWSCRCFLHGQPRIPTCPFVCWSAYLQTYQERNLPVYLYVVFLAYHKDLPGQSSVDLYAHRSTRSSTCSSHAFSPAYHEDLLVHSPVDQYAHRSTRLSTYLLISIIFFRLTTKTYLSTHLVVCLYICTHIYVPIYLSVQQPTCSFKCFLLGLPRRTICPLTCWSAYPYIYLYPFINLHFHFDLFFPANHEGVTIHSPTGRLVHRPTRSSSYLFILTFPSG